MKVKNLILSIVISLSGIFCYKCGITKDPNTQNEILNFLYSKELMYSTDKGDIPPKVIQYLSKLDSSKFEIGDSSDLSIINLSDAQINGPDTFYSKFLRFTLQNKNKLLIVYVVGGFGSYDVIDYFSFDTKQCYRYSSAKIIKDTTILKTYLSQNQNPKKFNID